MSYKEVGGGSSWNFEKAKELEGEFVGTKTGQGDYNSNVHTIKEMTTGELVSVWGNTVLDNRFSKISTGTRVRIEYLGMKDSPNRAGKQYKDFQVDVWSDD